MLKGKENNGDEYENDRQKTEKEERKGYIQVDRVIDNGCWRRRKMMCRVKK